MVAVGECITEASICGLSVLRDPSVYIHSVKLCRGCQNIGCGGERSGSGLCILCWTEYLEDFRNGWWWCEGDVGG